VPKKQVSCFQTVEKVQKSLGFFFILWYNNIGDER